MSKSLKHGLLAAAMIILGIVLGAVSAFAQGYPYPYKFDSAASTNSTLVINGKALISSIVVGNSTTTLAWLKLYDVSLAPTCNTSTVVFKMPVPFGASNAGGGFVIAIPDGLTFRNGIGFCLTANQADNDNNNSVTGIAINFGIKGD